MTDLTFSARDIRGIDGPHDKKRPIERSLIQKLDAASKQQLSAAEARELGFTFYEVKHAFNFIAISEKPRSDDIGRRLCLAHADNMARCLESFDRTAWRNIHSAYYAEYRRHARGEITTDELTRQYVHPGEDDLKAWHAIQHKFDAEQEPWKFDRLVAWLSDPEPADWPLPTERPQKPIERARQELNLVKAAEAVINETLWSLSRATGKAIDEVKVNYEDLEVSIWLVHKQGE
jgi:hypothetical protein